MPRTRPRQHTPYWMRHLHTAARTTAFLLGVLALAALLSYVAYGMARPFVASWQEARAYAEERQQVEAKLHERDALREKIASIKSPEGGEELCREKGLVKPGEHVVYVNIDKPKVPAQPQDRPGVASLRETLGAGLTVGTLAFLLGGGLLIQRRRALRARRPAGTLTPRSELRRRRRHGHSPVREG